MIWSDIRGLYPSQWLVVEALKAYTSQDHYRKLEQLSVVEKFSDGQSALKACHQFNKQNPNREFYFLHTSREEILVKERFWVGVRGKNETPS